MFGSLKKKLSNAIQEGIVISESISEHVRQRVSTPTTPTANTTLGDSRSSSRSSLSLSQLDLPAQLNVAAGCNLLAKYEDDWQRIHNSNEHNSDKANKVAKQIVEIERRASSQRVAMSDLIQCLSCIPKLQEKLQLSLGTLQQVEELCLVIEDELEKLEDICEECDLQEFILEKQCSLSQYKQRKMIELEHCRQKVAAEHSAKIREHEERLRQIQRERHAVFDDAFRSDLSDFKQNGLLKKIPQPQNDKLLLEEVVLDEDNANNKDALEEFLNG